MECTEEVFKKFYGSSFKVRENARPIITLSLIGCLKGRRGEN